MHRTEIFEQLRPIIADSLALKISDIQPGSRLIDDLGADSLDFVDIIFGLEKKFGVKMRDGELDFLTRLDFSSPQVMRAGYVAEETLHKLRPWLPELNQVAEPSKVTPAKIFSLITIETLCALIERRQQVSS